MNTEATTLLRQTHPALGFANDVRTYLGLPTLSELPEPKEHYSAHSCPLAIAFGGDDLGIKVEVTGQSLITFSSEAADALTYSGAASATYAYGAYTIPAPAAVQEFVKQFDLTWGLEAKVKQQELQLATIATKTGFAHDAAYITLQNLAPNSYDNSPF